MVTIKFPPAIDISHWIPVANFRALTPLPWLIFTKATEGTTYRDPTYPGYARGIREAGARLGAFHFMRPGSERDQADWFCQYLTEVGLVGRELLACDLEVDGINLAQVQNFLDRVEDKTDIRPLIYSSQLIIENLYPNKVCPEWIKDEWLWIAEYPPAPDLTNEIPSWIVPRGCRKERVALWQYSNDGVIGGIPGNNVDLNLINPLFAQAIGLTEPNQEIPPMPDTYYEVVSIDPTQYRSIRSGPVITASKIGQIEAGNVGRARVDDEKVYEADLLENGLLRAKRGDRWVHLVENNGVPVDGWVAEIHLGVRYTNLTLKGSIPADEIVITQTFSSPGYVSQTVTTVLKPQS